MLDNNYIFNELRELAKRIGVEIRYEKGNFQSNSCVINNQKIIIINSDAPQNTQNKTIAKLLNEFGIDNIYITPSIREFIENQD